MSVFFRYIAISTALLVFVFGIPLSGNITDNYSSLINGPVVHAQTSTTYNFMQPLGLPGFGGDNGQINVSQSSFDQYVNTLIQVAIGFAILLAVMMVIAGGVEYMGARSVTNKDDAKGRIGKAIGGLILALSAVVILQTINPNLVELKPLDEVNVEGENINPVDFTGSGWCAFRSYHVSFGKSGGNRDLCRDSFNDCSNLDPVDIDQVTECVYYGEYPDEEYVDGDPEDVKDINDVSNKVCTYINPSGTEAFYYCTTSVSGCKKVEEKWEALGNVSISKSCAVYNNGEVSDYVGGCYIRELKATGVVNGQNRFPALSDYEFTNQDGNQEVSPSSDRVAICKPDLEECINEAYHNPDDNIFDGRPPNGEDETTGIGYYMTVNLYNEYSGSLDGLAGILHGQECRAYPKNFSSQGDGSEIDWCFTWSGVPESASTPISGAACRADKNICQSDRQTTVDAYPDADISNCSQLGYNSDGNSEVVYNQMMQANIINGTPPESEVREIFSSEGIDINKGACNNVDPNGSCTNVGGLSQQAINGVIELKNNYKNSNICTNQNCPFEVTGGTSWWFHGNQNANPHENGETYHNPTGLGLPTGAIDLSEDDTLSAYINQELGINNSGCSDGNYYLNEDNPDHWHIVFDKPTCNN